MCLCDARFFLLPVASLVVRVCSLTFAKLLCCIEMDSIFTSELYEPLWAMDVVPPFKWADPLLAFNYQ